MRSSITIAFLHVASLVTARSFPSSAIRWTDCSKNVPDSDGTFNSSTVDLAHLPPNLHCGQLDVPMDYSKPFCDTNKITLGLAMVRPEKPKVALFLWVLDCGWINRELLLTFISATLEEVTLELSLHGRLHWIWRMLLMDWRTWTFLVRIKFLYYLLLGKVLTDLQLWM